MPHFSFKISAASLALLVILYIQGGSLLAFSMLLASLALHECSHMFIIHVFGYKISELKLTPFGGRLIVDPLFEVNPEAEFFISASGPFINWIMVGGVAYLQLLGVENIFLTHWQKYNFLIGFINLIPASPLDGGRIFHSWITRHFGLISASFWSKVVSTVTALSLTGFAIIKLIQKEGGSFYLLIGFFILFHLFSWESPQIALFWRLLQRKKKLLTQKGHLPVINIAVTPKTLLRNVLTNYTSDNYLQFVVYQDGKVVRTITEEKAWEFLMARGFKTTFMETLKTKDSVSLQNMGR